MPLKTALLRSSLEKILAHDDHVARRFYTILEGRYPQLRGLSARKAVDVRARLLTQSLVVVLDHLADTPWLNRTLATWGARGAEDGVTEAMYPPFEECLIEALAESAGDAWTTDVEMAWVDAIQTVSSTLQDGARAAS